MDIVNVVVVVVLTIGSVLMYRDDIQLWDVKGVFWYELHALTFNG